MLRNNGFSRRPFGSPFAATAPGTGSSALEALVVHAAVRKLQVAMNAVYAALQADPRWGYNPPYGRIGEDGKYANRTHKTLKYWIKSRVQGGACGAGYDYRRVDVDGPNAVRDCIAGAGGGSVFSGADLDEIQLAWREWRAAAASDYEPPPADEPSAEPGSGPPLPSEGPTVEEGMGAGTWALIIILGALLGGGIYYLATED